MRSRADIRWVAIVLACLTRGIASVAADDSAPRHLVYLHGRIVQEEQSRRPVHPTFGYYELDAIADAFRTRGFVVHADVRPKSASLGDSADDVVEQVRRLLAAGVPADHVAVVGGSQGAQIALLVAARLHEPDVRFALLGFCPSVPGSSPVGRVLVIREESDDATRACPPWKPAPGLHADEIVLRTGLSHGFLYRPLPEWVDPVVAWATSASRP